MDKEAEINRLQALKNLQLDSICQLRRRSNFWHNVCNKIITKKHKVNRQLSATVRAYNETDRHLAELDGRLKICSPAAPKDKKPITSKQLKIQKNLANIGLSDAQIEHIIQAVID